MLQLKSKHDILYTAFMVCLIESCEEEASKLWPTETSIIDVCDRHYNELEAEKYLT